jgi:hypothetical protein
MISEVMRVYRWFEKHSLRLVVIAGVVLLLLIALWLSITTRTAMYFAGIEELEQTRLAQIDRINQHWKSLGETSTPKLMVVRAELLGFRTAPVEYVLVEPAAVSSAEVVTDVAVTP